MMITESTVAGILIFEQISVSGVCAETLYRYVDLGLFGIRNHNLPEKLKRKSKKHRSRINKKKLGRSTPERPREIESREEFRHWE
jgi:IS30 family transposase